MGTFLHLASKLVLVSLEIIEHHRQRQIPHSQQTYLAKHQLKFTEAKMAKLIGCLFTSKLYLVNLFKDLVN